MSLRQELIEYSKEIPSKSGQNIDVVKGDVPEWIRRQLELDILLTTALLDGAAYKWQSLTLKTVKVLRRAFFLSLTRKLDSSNKGDSGALKMSRRTRECAQKNLSKIMRVP